MTARIKVRHDTASNWSDINPILALGEPGLETDTNKVKYGDGTTAWSDLAYTSAGLPNGMIADYWYGAPNLTNDLNANSDANDMQFQVQTNWWDNEDYGRATLSWHDSEYSNYTHVHTDVHGVSIRNADWDGNRTDSYHYWLFDFEGRTRFPNGIMFNDDWDGNITNDYISIYEHNNDQAGERYGQNYSWNVQLQSMTDWYNNEDYGRGTLSWHDYNYSNYSHVMVDPNGAFIRLSDWDGNRGGYHKNWAFNTDGSTTMPGTLTIENGKAVRCPVNSGWDTHGAETTYDELSVWVDTNGNVGFQNLSGTNYQVQYAGTLINASTGTSTVVASDQSNVIEGSGGTYQIPTIALANKGDTLTLTVQIPDSQKVFRVTAIGTYGLNVESGHATIIIERLV